MEFFIDTAEVNEIKEAYDMGLVDGVTTNPSLIKKSGRDHEETIREISSIVPGPISVETLSDSYEDMIKEAKEYQKWGNNIVIKVVMTPEGMKVVRALSQEGIKTNVTVTFSANQALIAAKAGATYVSPFVGRLEANAGHGSLLISEIVKIFNNYSFDTQIIAASMRTSVYVKEAALAGAHIATVPPTVLDDVMNSELSDLALKGFLEEWNKLSTEKKNIFENIKNI